MDNQSSNGTPNFEEEDWSFADKLDLTKTFRDSGMLITHTESALVPPSEWGPSAIEANILRLFFEIRPASDSHKETSLEVAKRLGIRSYLVFQIVKKALLRKEAKKQRRDYADKIYGEKIPLAKSIVGKSLTKLDNFLTAYTPTNIEDAKGLAKIATDVTTLLRLELGQATQQVEIMHKTQRDVNVILHELKDNDPFVDYPDTIEGELVKDPRPEDPKPSE